MKQVRQAQTQNADGEPISIRVAQELLRWIRSGQLKARDRLPSEQALADRFKVSRPSIREALSALQFAGYLGSRQGFGTVVLTADRREQRSRRGRHPDFVEVFEARVLVEPEAIRLAAVRPEASAVKAARSMLDGMWLAVDAAGELGVNTDLALHRAEVEICPNKTVRELALELLDSTNSPNSFSARTSTWAHPELIEGWAVEHEAILSAVQAREPERAALCARRHLLSAIAMVAQRDGTEDKDRQRLNAVIARHDRRSPLPTPVRAAQSIDGSKGQRGRAQKTA